MNKILNNIFTLCASIYLLMMIREKLLINQMDNYYGSSDEDEDLLI